ncbi:MAG TPA: D-arabinono-1,4-lactone oxidase, partial [Acidimicrobiales bacterium]
HSSMLSLDRGTGRVTVQAGMTIAALNKALAAAGLALPNLGDIAYQTISGAISTATHGTGIRFGGIATQVVGLEVVTADGSVVHCSPEVEPELFACARVGLGALGVLSSVTLQAVPAFHLHAVEEPMRLPSVLRDLDRHIAANDHFELMYVPHTEWALTKRNNRTDGPVGGMPRWKWAWQKGVMENVAFGALCRIGRRRPSLIPRLATALPSSGRVEYVEVAHRVFTSPRWVHFYEMEYSVPRAAAVEAVERVRAFIDTSGLRISFPVEVRFTAADDIPLSTAYGGERCYIAVHVYRGMEHERYFRGVEEIMRSLAGRPHWGKLHFRTAADLAPVYPEWDRFQAVRRKADPDGVFANDYLDRVLGPCV